MERLLIEPECASRCPQCEAGLCPVSAGGVALVGGDPLLHRAVEAWVGELVAGGRDVVLATSARGLTAARASRLRGASLDVPLLGDHEALHDFQAGAAGAFRETVLGLRRARAAGLPFALWTPWSRAGYRHLSGMVRLAHALGARALRVDGERAAALGLRPAPRGLGGGHWRRAVHEARSLGFPLFLGADVPTSARAWFALDEGPMTDALLNLATGAEALVA